MKKVELTHAEICPVKKDSNETTRINQTKGEKPGWIINFQIKTRVNDRVSNSPFVFEKCNFWTADQEKVNDIKNILQLGNIIDCKGTETVGTAYDDPKTGKKVYPREIRVLEITPVQVTETTNQEDRLPF
ncbi:MAG: hypothetical protein M0R17_03190 [Candidatus Omnitrophica bacterium]|jgi:hypothetical protein|nr:hypothetical protein [Candidatus Omnitrophota bacterium]